jgi:hypothetical protein
MRKVFPSAIGWIMVIPLVILLGLILLIRVKEPGKWQSLMMQSLCALETTVHEHCHPHFRHPR